MSLCTLPRFTSLLRKNQLIIDGYVLHLTQEQASVATDGPDGWNIIEILCHLRDFERVSEQRVALMLAGDNPALPVFLHDQMAIELAYRDQKIDVVIAELKAERDRRIAHYETLTSEQAARTGVHPELGQVSVTDLALQAVGHDIDHLQQMARCLGLTTMTLPD